jgi:aryl-alcohol dehydrogenase-like predicted oxidoreductase
VRYRPLGDTGLEASEVSFGTWALGAEWGPVDRDAGVAGLRRAVEGGVNLFDTADVYGRGRSEELLGEVFGDRDDVLIATKFCRWTDASDPATYTWKSISSFCEASLRRLRRERIDLYQIHCPPTGILERGEVFDHLERLQSEGKIRFAGVSVESAEQGRICLRYPSVRALQVIFNLFRQNLVDELFPHALRRRVGLLARVPLASGLLTGKFTQDTTFPADDHRTFNREGAAFNVGETFAGLAFPVGVELADELRWIAVRRGSMAAAALRWILDHEAVTCAIPGFKNVSQVEQSLSAADVRPFGEAERERLADFYRERVRPAIRGPL